MKSNLFIKYHCRDDLIKAIYYDNPRKALKSHRASNAVCAPLTPFGPNFLPLLQVTSNSENLPLYAWGLFPRIGKTCYANLSTRQVHSPLDCTPRPIKGNKFTLLKPILILIFLKFSQDKALAIYHGSNLVTFISCIVFPESPPATFASVTYISQIGYLF